MTLLKGPQVLTVAFHESGHALTGLCTGAHIESIELDPELGGLTTMRGGIQYITLPAGVYCSILHACRARQHHDTGHILGTRLS